MKRLWICLGVVGLIACSVLAWRQFRYTYTEMASYSEIAGKRYERAKTADSISIAVVWPQEGADEDNSLWNGARQAQDEINSRSYPLQDENGNPFQAGRGRPYYHKHPVGAYDLEEGRPVCRGIPIRVQTGVVDGNQVWEIRCLKIDLQNIAPRDQAAELDSARRIARDPRFVAVLGHSSNDTAKFAAVSYQQTDLLFFSVNVTDPSLTNHKFGYVFRMIPNDYEAAKAVVKMVAEFNHCNGIGEERRGRMGIFYARSAYAMNAVETITASLGEIDRNLDYVFEKSYDIHLAPPLNVVDPGFFSSLTGLFGGSGRRDSAELKRQNLREMIDEVKNKYPGRGLGPGFDVILLVDDQSTRAGEILSLLRSRGVSQPVLAGATLDDEKFFKDSVVKQIYNTLGSPCPGAATDRPATPLSCPPADPADENRPPASASGAPPTRDAAQLQNLTLISSVFDAAGSASGVKKFVGKFREEHRRLPDFIAAQGYEAMMVMAQAFERSESIAPIDVADTLRSQGPFQGLTEPICFTPDGDIRGKRIYLKVFKNEDSNNHPDR